ncbi:MAG TPA: MOSC domain-containing protein [Gammaproteobacteria bacterium]|nr:MOSC domain-containing protein [Gammaproteobacteria bacterium]
MKVTEINIYPIKSTRRIALGKSEVLPRGLPWDRRWMLVDADGKFITGRQQPLLAVVDTRLSGEALQVSVADRPVLSLPLQAPEAPTLPVTIWRDQCDAVAAGAEADAWFSDYLGTPCRLVRLTDNLVRGVDPEYSQPGDEVSFADGFPLLLASEASLADLNRRLDSPVQMRRFRPNLVVDGELPYAEDNWHRLRIGEVEFEGVKNCSRCVFTTIDPDTGLKHPGKEPLHTLAGYRRRPQGGVYFGQNLIPRSGGTIHVGDPVEIVG